MNFFPRQFHLSVWGLVALWLVSAAALDGPPNPTPLPTHDAGPDLSRSNQRGRALDGLLAFERERRQETNFLTLPPSSGRFGTDPFRLTSLPGDDLRFAGILRGDDAVAIVDASTRTMRRAIEPTPPSPTGLAFDGVNLWVSSGASNQIAAYRYERNSGELTFITKHRLEGLVTARDVATGPPGMLYIVDELTDRLESLRVDSAGAILERRRITTDAGPIRVMRIGPYILVNAVIGHTIAVYPLDADGWPSGSPLARIAHDGPLWSVDAVETESGLTICAGGVENRPLDRSGGFFGHVDSFCFLYRFERHSAGPRLTPAGTLNVSEHGVITPKAVRLRPDTDGRPRAWITGYGSPGALSATWDEDGTATVESIPFPPGTTDLATLRPSGDPPTGEDPEWISANPLLDAWVFLVDGVVHQLPTGVSNSGRPVPDPLVRLGEALFYTTLMAPTNSSDGPRSRFTCETCHFEGGVDGRTHFTGREAIHATTKPLLGLFNNKPHFSRALDPDLAGMVNSEFRVAGAAGEQDPWFSLNAADHGWLASMTDDPLPGTLSPETLRRALMRYLMEFTHPPNPRVFERSGWTPLERDGARLFERLCETCHGARAIADAPMSRVPFQRWEALVFSAGGPIVWGSGRYEKTGVEPYVHPRGTRVPSLRRLERKRPYFTNGSAKTLEDVLDRVRYDADRFFHVPPEAGQAARENRPNDGTNGSNPSFLTAEERAALGAFLRLL